MTIAVDMGRKATKTKQNKELHFDEIYIMLLKLSSILNSRIRFESAKKSGVMGLE